MRRTLLPLAALAALALAVALSATPAYAAHGQLVRMRGSAIPATARAARLGAAPASATIDAVVFMRPRNAWLLRKVAAARSAAPGLTTAQLRALFIPRPAQVARLESYLESQGLRVTDHHLLSLVVTGSVANQERAFGTAIALYRGRGGRVFRAPTGAVRLPRDVAPLVQSVGGLDTALRVHPATRRSSKFVPGTVTATCSGAQNAQSVFLDSFLPADLGSADAYNHNSLINAGDDGDGQSIGLIEFSNYKHADITGKFDSCFPAITSTDPTNVDVDGGTTDLSGADEVELDIEVARAAAPHAATYVYIAPNNSSRILLMLDQIIEDQGTTHIHIVSDSWGLCEPLLPLTFVRSENTVLELAAAAGISFYAATGDDGSSACGAGAGLWLSDPSSQPFATAVGGTHLLTPRTSTSEKAWKYGGGGQSENWPMPQWQSGHTGSTHNSGANCGYLVQTCRETPDIALDAAPGTGYIYYCSVGASICGGFSGWLAIGGTSAATPLMAGITADANEFAGTDLGFASPFLYAHAGVTGLFNDITTGSNNVTGGTQYQALTGYDMATGLGSPNAQVLANTLMSAGSPGFTAPDSTDLTTNRPAANATVSYGDLVRFSGHLNDTSGGSTPVANTPVYVLTSLGFIGEGISQSNGHWVAQMKNTLLQNETWRAVFLGSDTLAPSITPKVKLFVVPRLSAALTGNRSAGVYHIKISSAHVFEGQSMPNMTGARVFAQTRDPGQATWHNLGSSAVNKHSKYQWPVKYQRARTVLLRWVFQGGKTKRWMTGISPTITVVVG